MRPVNSGICWARYATARPSRRGRTLSTGASDSVRVLARAATVAAAFDVRVQNSQHSDARSAGQASGRRATTTPALQPGARPPTGG